MDPFDPAIHRWIGRTFLVAAIGASLGGIWMIWVREATLGTANSYGTTGNALLILAFAGLAWRAARHSDESSV